MSVLAKELWTEIYGYLEIRDIRNCLAVCKAWNKVATPLLKDCIHIVLRKNQFEPLLSDLTRHPALGQKVSKLTVAAVDRSEEPTVLKSILNFCPNLHVLKFNETRIQGYLEMLDSERTQMPNIQRIEVEVLAKCYQDFQQIHIDVNYRFSSTIKALFFGGVADENFENYDGFTQYLSNFSHLTSLEIWQGEYISKPLSLDMNQILEKCTSLESLCIRKEDILKGDLARLPPSVDIHYPTLKSLRLYKCDTDVNLLTYIPARFVNLEELAFANVYVEFNAHEVPEKMIEKMIDDFVHYPVERFNLDFYCNGESYRSFSCAKSYFKKKSQRQHGVSNQEPLQVDLLDEFFANIFLNELEYA